MTKKKNHDQDQELGFSTPSGITLVKLRDHFKQKYGLSESQVEVMVVSSSKSLEQGLADLAAFLEGGGLLEGVRATYHGLKGLFLNMGEVEWAAYIKEIEQKLLVGDPLDHEAIAGILHRGVAKVLTYCGTTDAGLTKK